jgi:hypothetical protein
MAKLERVLSGFSNGDLQKLTGIPASVINAFRTGRYNPSQKSIDRLTAHYKRTLPKTYDYTPQPTTKRAKASTHRAKHQKEIDFVLKSFKNKDIIKGSSILRPGHTGKIIQKIKYTKKGKKIYRSAETGTVKAKISGVDIDPRLLDRMRTGESPGTKDAIDKLLSVYRSLNRQLLLASGASAKEANRFSNKTPDEVQKICAKYRKIAAIIAKRKGVPIEMIIAGMQKSEKDFESYDYYIKAVLK